MSGISLMAQGKHCATRSIRTILKHGSGNRIIACCYSGSSVNLFQHVPNYRTGVGENHALGLCFQYNNKFLPSKQLNLCNSSNSCCPRYYLHTSAQEKQKGSVISKEHDEEETTVVDKFVNSQRNGTAERPEFQYLDTTFNNAQEAYKSKTLSELIRALFIFHITSFESLVNNNDKILKVARKILGKRLFSFFMKRTFYGQFVAGADVNEIAPLLAKNHKYGVKSILDYSVEEDMPEEEAKEKTKKAFEQSSQAEDASKSGQFSFHEQFGDRRKNVTSARTYFYDSEAQCDKNMWTFMKCVDVVSEATAGTGLAAIKMTALGRPKFLLQMSHVLTTMKETFDKLTYEETDVVLKRIKADTLESNLSHLGVPISRDDTKQWFTWLDISENKEIDLYSWSNLIGADGSLRGIFTVPNLEKGALVSMFPSLSAQQERELSSMFQRINRVVEHAAERNVRVMVDAEQTYFQPAISRLVMEMMRKFNKETPVVFNTYQCYLKSAHANFSIDMDLAKREGFTLGCKVVRGAYMEQEKHRAASIGYPDPINASFEATTAMYHKVVDTALQEAVTRGRGQVAVMAATHNEDSIRYCVQRLKDYGLRREDKALCFGQLLGMCDHITFPLGQSGYSVYKYVPYGPVEEVLPYLTRRAAENRGILAKVRKERQLLRSEVKRRVLPFVPKN